MPHHKHAKILIAIAQGIEFQTLNIVKNVWQDATPEQTLQAIMDMTPKEVLEWVRVKPAHYETFMAQTPELA